MSDQSPTEVRVRRAPKFGAFLVVGGALGALVTLILTSLYPVDPNVGFGPLYAYFCLFGIPAGVLVGALLALMFDRRSRKRAKVVEAERDEVVAPPAAAGEIAEG